VYQCDHLGTPLRLVTPEGDVVWQAHYETWGEAQVEIERVVNPLRFQGQYYDGETGLHYNLARYYDPRTGRFIQPDPIGLLGGLNHYQYAPNPVMWIDPTGLCAKEDSTLPIDALAENPQQTLITSTLPASYQLSMLAAMPAPAPVPSPSPLPSSRPPAIGRINVGAAANDPMYNRLSPKPRLKLLPLAGTASTFLTGMLYSPSLGGSLEEMVAPDGTTYSKYSDERLYKAVGADGEVWQTVDPQEDIAYRAWLANGGDGTFEEWIAQGKPSEIDGSGVQSKITEKYNSASFGESTITNYKKTFFEANPDTDGAVVVHHAVEQQVLKRYPDVVSESEMHSLENLRGIPKEVNSDVHLSKIRKEWNRFYRENPSPTKQQLLDKATEIDDKFGAQFNPPIRD
ncbi:RHS repeat-associated core domain-containing protein, partial [Vibrio metschnikovii]|uniref:RHS repeat-associated core domain-containing protein n=1 Tax=Vibrio metschnikovii TaxID=28172 RepID=UPI0020C637B2